MTVAVKICGINSDAALDAATLGGADYVGFVFYPPSPRALSPDDAAPLARRATPRRVGVFVNPDDALVDQVLQTVPLDCIQLHGREDPARVAEVGARTGLPIIKAIPVADADDIAAARQFEDAAQMLLFDAKPPKSMARALPGGNALRFDWELLASARFSLPWFLSGGLDADVVADAIRISGARAVDVSSGVEDSPGLKSPAKIRAFLNAAKETEKNGNK